MSILDNRSRLERIKTIYGLRIAKRSVVSNFVRQLRLEKAIRKYIIERHGGEQLVADVHGMIREYSDNNLEVAYIIFEEHGIFEAIANHPDKVKKSVRKKLLAL